MSTGPFSLAPLLCAAGLLLPCAHARPTKADRQPLAQLRIQAEQGNAQSQFELGAALCLGKLGVATDYVEAVKWFRRAADKGHAEAQNCLGGCYTAGQGVEKDAAEAVKWFRRAASQGWVEAQHNLGFAYATGAGVAKDEVEAVRWYRQAAARNYADAQFNLGICYERGQGVTKDEVEAVKWYRQAAGQDYAKAQSALGHCYANGLGLAKDEVEAVKWYRQAADQNNPVAQANLGLAYAHGQGVVMNEREAVGWFRKAAEQNFAGAQFLLGRSYHYGHGVAKDEVEAVQWYRRSIANGSDSACNNLAWILATSANPAIRDGSNAVTFAKQAVAADQRKNPNRLDTLAAAFAEAGQFDQAVSTLQEAIPLLNAGAEQEVFRSRLKLYEAREPYREKGQ